MPCFNVWISEAANWDGSVAAVDTSTAIEDVNDTVLCGGVWSSPGCSLAAKGGGGVLLKKLRVLLPHSVGAENNNASVAIVR